MSSRRARGLRGMRYGRAICVDTNVATVDADPLDDLTLHRAQTAPAPYDADAVDDVDCTFSPLRWKF
jgi:hypothetical protein